MSQYINIDNINLTYINILLINLMDGVRKDKMQPLKKLYKITELCNLIAVKIISRRKGAQLRKVFDMVRFSKKGKMCILPSH